MTGWVVRRRRQRRVSSPWGVETRVVVLRYSFGCVAKGISQGDGAGLAVGRSESLIPSRTLTQVEDGGSFWSGGVLVESQWAKANGRLLYRRVVEMNYLEAAWWITRAICRGIVQTDLVVQVARLAVGVGSLIQDLIQGSGTKRNGRNGESGLERSTQIRLRERSSGERE